jgi:hypothetical protein
LWFGQKGEKHVFFCTGRYIRNYPSPKKEITIQTCSGKVEPPPAGTGGFQVAGLNILFDFFKTLNVSFNILKSNTPLY